VKGDETGCRIPDLHVSAKIGSFVSIAPGFCVLFYQLQYKCFSLALCELSWRQLNLLFTRGRSVSYIFLCQQMTGQSTDIARFACNGVLFSDYFMHICRIQLEMFGRTRWCLSWLFEIRK